MIAQILDGDFVQKQCQAAATLLTELSANDSHDEALVALLRDRGLTPEQLREALTLLRDAPQRDQQALAEPIAKAAYFSRDEVVSLFQSALEAYYEEQRPDLIQTAAGPGAAAADPPVTDRSLKGVAPAAQKLFEKFSITDVGWASSLVAQGLRKVRGRRAFPRKAADPFPIADRARILLVGDWATGTPRARKVGRVMRAILDGPGPGAGNQHVIHLGDVYYSGYEREYKNRFLPYWPVRPGEEGAITSWCLNGNHDMYAGGFGYFDYLLQDPRFKHQQGSSYFSLRNQHWHLFGLDTAYEEHDLADPQAAWLGVEVAASPKAIMLSHHQPFSAYEKGGEKLLAKVQPVLGTGRVRAWFWGHEHRCALYEPAHGIAAPRLIGHGGVPVYASDAALPAGVGYAYQESFETGFESWALFGFAVLDFDGDCIDVRYINEYGYEHHRETLT